MDDIDSRGQSDPPDSMNLVEVLSTDHIDNIDQTIELLSVPETEEKSVSDAGEILSMIVQSPSKESTPPSVLSQIHNSSCVSVHQNITDEFISPSQDEF